MAVNPVGDMLPDGPLGWLVGWLMTAMWLGAVQRVIGPWSRALGDRYAGAITAWFRRREEQR